MAPGATSSSGSIHLVMMVVAAAIVTCIAVPLLDPLARRIGVIAHVSPDRWHRTGDIGLHGGPALLLGLLPWTDPGQAAVLAGFCTVGVIDDYCELRPAWKATLLILPCSAAAWLTGHLWVGVGCWCASNAVNLLDHADGLAGASAAGSLAVAGGSMGLAGAGASCGFLIHNVPPARVFLGDGGSLMLGALLVLAWSPSGVWATLLGTAVPAADAAFVTMRRLAKRRAPWVGGTDHTGHLILGAGVRPTVLIISYGVLSAAFGFAGRLLSR